MGHILFLPLLCIARISWVVQSIITVATSPDVPDSRTRVIEAGTLALHYAYYGAIAYFLLDSWHSILLFVFLSQAVAGLALGTVFVINHNSMEILDSDAVTHTNFVAMQIRTTRNITPSLAGDWFSGGLSYQIEHHLSPPSPATASPKSSPASAPSPKSTACSTSPSATFQALSTSSGTSRRLPPPPRRICNVKARLGL